MLYEGDGGWFVLLQLGDSEPGFMKSGQSSQAEIFWRPFTGQGPWVAVDVDDVDREYTRIRALGVEIAVDLRDEPRGDRHFVVADPKASASTWFSMAIRRQPTAEHRGNAAHQRGHARPLFLRLFFGTALPRLACISS